MSIKISEEKINKISQIILKNANVQRQNMSDENKMFSIYLHDPHMQPRKCAERFNQKYGGLSDGRIHTGDEVIRSFKMTRMSKISERERLFEECVELSNLIIKSLAENTKKYMENINKKITGHSQKKRIILLAMFEMNEQLNKQKCREEVYKLNRSFAEDCIDAILMLIEGSIKPKRIISPEEYESEIIRLDSELSRANKMIERLQNEFDEELEDAKVQARVDIISQLNSRDYGYILDMLHLANIGFRKLRRSDFVLPIEINMIPVLTRNLMRFVSDSGIEPIENIGDEMEIMMNETGEYEYDGSAFSDKNEKKTVKIVSCGWEIPEENIVISKPRIKESEE